MKLNGCTQTRTVTVLISSDSLKNQNCIGIAFTSHLLPAEIEISGLKYLVGGIYIKVRFFFSISILAKQA